MPSFSPPTELQACDDVLFGRYSIPVGQSVVKVDGHYRLTPYPWLGELVGQDGVDYFLGGHIYQITSAVAADLTDDGFTVEYGGYGETGYGTGGYGVNPYGG